MFKQLLPFFSSKGNNAKLTILIYHRVLEKPDPYREGEVTAEEFDWHMREVAKNFQVIKLGDAVKNLKNGELPAGALCITFDDGYADNFTVALPILKKWNLPATFFISTSFLDGGCMWNDVVIDSVSNTREQNLDLSMHELGYYSLATPEQRMMTISELIKKVKHLPYEARSAMIQAINEALNVKIRTDIMMSTEQIRGLHEQDMEIGAHTVTHPILTKLENQAALAEIETSKKILQDMLSSKIELFAYPNGKPIKDYNEQHVAMVKELGFEAAVSTAWGVSNRYSDLYQLPRFTPWDKTPGKFMLRLMRNYLN